METHAVRTQTTRAGADDRLGHLDRPRGRALVVGTVAAMVAALLAALPSSAVADDIVVTTALDDSQLDAGDDPACPTSGTDQCTLRAAVAAADDGDVIVFEDGVHPEIAGADGPVRIEDLDLVIRGNLDAGGPGTTISAAGDLENRMFEVADDGVLAFENVTVTGANLTGGSGDGGAVLNEGSLTVSNSAFTGNRVAVTTGSGGAIASSGDLVVQSSTFADNQAHGNTIDNPASGGAIQVLPGGDATVEGSTFTGNEATRVGGAIAATDAELVLSDSTFGGPSGAGNRARSGGAVSIGGDESTASARISGSHFEGNAATAVGGGATARYGGAIYVTIADATIVESTVIDNSAETNGGGIAIFASSAEVTAKVELVRSLVADNTAGNEGGGISIDTGVLEATNSTISGNTADAFGGAVSAVGAPPLGGTSTFTHVTVVENDAQGASPAGGGLVYYADATATVGHSIVADNVDGDCVVQPGALGSDGYNLDSDGTCVDEFSGATDQTVGDIVLGSLASNGGPTMTHLPLEGSPAIDGGLNPSCVVSVDQRGLPRPAADSAACDIGAVEVQPASETEEEPQRTPETEESVEEEPDTDASDPDPATSDDPEVIREAGAAEPITADPDYAG